ncbi:MAG: hypothetical protein QXI49_05520 [Candidatus Methanomethylicaceae archaeon]
MEKKNYFLIVECWENGEICFDILKTKYDEGSQELYDLIDEKYMHNLNSVFWMKVNKRMLMILKGIVKKLEKVM